MVQDKVTNEGLIGANVILKGTNMGTATLVDGSYVIKDIKPGEYNLEITSEIGGSFSSNYRGSSCYYSNLLCSIICNPLTISLNYYPIFFTSGAYWLVLLTRDWEKVLFECLDVLLELGISHGDYVFIFYMTANYCISSVNDIFSLLLPYKSIPLVLGLLLLIFSTLFFFTRGRPFYGVII